MSTDLYTCERYGTGPQDWRLVLRRPIQTRDAVTIRTSDPARPLFGRDDAVRFPTARERGQTRDDLLDGGPAPPTRISLGTVWAGDDGDPLVTAANYATQAFAAGCFAPDQPLDAESLENVISRGKVWIGQLEAVQSKLANADSSGLGSACDKPPRTEDALTRRRPSLFGSARTATVDYAAGLKKGREAPHVTAPAKVTTGADYAKNLAAGRTAKGAV
jgi:hypothetical protein